MRMVVKRVKVETPDLRRRLMWYILPKILLTHISFFLKDLTRDFNNIFYAELKCAIRLFSLPSVIGKINFEEKFEFSILNIFVIVIQTFSAKNDSTGYIVQNRDVYFGNI